MSSIFSVGFGAWLFMYSAPNNDSNIVVEDAKETETLSREQLKAVLETYKQRALNFEKLQKAIDTVPDPSR